MDSAPVPTCTIRFDLAKTMYYSHLAVYRMYATIRCIYITGVPWSFLLIRLEAAKLTMSAHEPSPQLLLMYTRFPGLGLFVSEERVVRITVFHSIAKQHPSLMDRYLAILV